MHRPLVAVALAFAASACRPAEPPPARPPAEAQVPVIGKTEVRSLRSNIVAQEYRLFIAHPSPAGPPGTKYPVVYTLDGNGEFGTVTEAIRTAQLGGELPAAIVVGIGYPVGGMDETLNLRMRDYTPTSDTAFVRVATAMWGGGPDAQSGGAPAFLRFIREELKPFVDSTLPVDPGNATLIGHSFGGLFATYVLLHHPDTFQRYVIGSPSIWWHQRVSFEFEKAYAAANRDLPARVFVAAGGLETAEEFKRTASQFPESMQAAIAEWERTMGPPQMVELIGPFERALRGRRYPGLSLTTHIYPGETHTSVLPGLIARGLRVVFGTYSGG